MSSSTRKSSRSSLGSQRSHGSVTDSQRSKDAEFYTECRVAYLAVFDRATDLITSKEDLSLVLHQAGRNLSNKILAKYWTSRTDSLSYDDFCDIMKKEKATSRSDLMKAFKKIDINGDGYITHDELYKVLTERGETMTKAEVRAMIDEADDDGDRRLDYDEFCNMLLSTSNKLMTAAREKVEKTTSKTKKAPKPSPRIRRTEDSDADSVISKSSTVVSKSSRGATSMSLQPVSKSITRSQEPKNLRNWHHVHKKGAFYFDDDGPIISHQYTLEVNSATSVWLTIQPIKPNSDEDESMSSTSGSKPVDTALYIVKEDDDEPTEFVAFTETRHQQKYTLQCDLRSGTYRLIPFTTGCRFKRKRSESSKAAHLVKKDKESDEFVLTKQFRNALSDIFDMIDLDGNGTLSREEFDFFQVRTSGEHCDDDAWEVVEENFELKNGEITKKGFNDLHQMEANDNDGDLDDLWTTMTSMGFSKDLTLDEACPFKLDVYTENSRVKLKALEAQEGGNPLKDAVNESVLKNGESSRVRGMKDLTMYTYTGDVRASIALNNKSHSRVKVRLDCSQSKNCVSNRDNLDFTVDVPSKSTVVGHHLLPANERLDWNVKCTETIMK
ncbi:EF-hand calcium-binding domain-containing protein 7-like isoform X1 [Glandiceps talaboti]